MAKVKYPEWIEFEGVRYKAKLTKKRLTVWTGETRQTWTRSAKSVTRDDTISFATSVPDYGDGHWYDMHAIGHDYGRHKIPHVLDPYDPPPASDAILERLAQVREALDRREKAKAEEARQREEREKREAILYKWSDKARSLESKMTKAAVAGDYDKVVEYAKERHEWEKEKPSF